MLKLTYISHSAFILSDEQHTVIIDPFITNNPTAKLKVSDIQADFIFLTHAHSDHFGDTLEIAQRNYSLVICVNELANYVATKGVRTHGMNIGGGYEFPFGKLKLTIAHHGSAKSEYGDYMGDPSGVVINMGGKTVYHCGDTGLFLDMKLIGELSKPDIMLVPIGGNYTMGIDEAVVAVDFVKPAIAIPMHFNTFPVIEADPTEFVDKVNKRGNKARLMHFGETLEF
ncbi:hypothetical protein SDC9_106970 [bioreactor metagenome]|uniref:Metallo-beta-lactamase domain-containing protein n=1 Tax=bioreactor metagenome TaxID=1076179 RepID=A0A645BAF0_9ZZZZ